MSNTKNNYFKRLNIPAYWYVIGVLLLFSAVMYVYHLTSGVTPSRVAIHIPTLDFDIYWYGIWIVGGIALGSWVVASLANKRGEKIMQDAVPRAVRERPLAPLKLPEEIKKKMAKNGIKNQGDLLLSWGYDPRLLGLNKDGIAVVRLALDTVPDIEDKWINDAPWRIWNPDHVWNGIIWCLILGVIGARLYHILTPSPSMEAVGIYSPLDYFRQPEKLFDFRSGGLGIYGGIAGGALGLFLYTRYKKIPMMPWADLAVVGLALGQVFGRWGNFFNQELYGRPTDLPWAVQIDPLHRLPQFSEFTHFHPAFLYESLWSLLTFIVLYVLVTRFADRLLTGEVMALYLIFYAVGRSLLELVRLDSRTVSIGGIETSMAVATLVSIIIAILAGVIVLVRRWRLRTSAAAVA